jgi:hypothetical protein
MRALILVAGAALAVAACSKENAAENTMNVDEAVDMNADTTMDMNADANMAMDATTDANAADAAAPAADADAAATNAM